MNDPQEQWKAIPGFTSYEVSNYGGLYSLKNNCLLCLRPDEGGYMRTEITNGEEQKQIRVHVLVMLAFSGPCPDGYRVNHKNGVKYDNRWTNLEYTTASENTTHAYRTGLKKPIRGNSHWKTKIKDEEFDKIKELYATGKYSMVAIGKMYGTSKIPIRAILRGIRHVALPDHDESVGAKKNSNGPKT